MIWQDCLWDVRQGELEGIFTTRMHAEMKRLMPKMEGNTLVGWDCEEEDKRVLFMEHLYKCDNRHFPDHPKHGTYTGLWQKLLFE